MFKYVKLQFAKRMPLSNTKIRWLNVIYAVVVLLFVVDVLNLLEIKPLVFKLFIYLGGCGTKSFCFYLQHTNL